MKNYNGFTLIEIIVATLILSLAGLGVFGIFQIALKTLAGDKQREGAIAMLDEKMEIARNLPYGSVGTIGGVVAGNLAQEEQIEKNNVSYTIKTQIIYVDDPYDGTEDGAPEDELAIDYKKVKIDIEWQTSQGIKSVGTATIVAPKGIENTEGGGTLRIISLNASGEPAPEAIVLLKNNVVSPTVSTTLQTGSGGILNIPGLIPSDESYQIKVYRDGYNIDYTCAVDDDGLGCSQAEGNPQPTKAHASILEGRRTEISFNIDLLASLTINTLHESIPNIWTINTDGTGYDQNNVSFDQCANGNYVFGWRDFRQSNNPRIYAQKYSGAETQLWAEDLAVTTANNQNNPDIAVDSDCYSYIAWQDDRNGNQDIYLDKINAAGASLWLGSKKVETENNSADQSNPVIAINASSTAIYLVWQDTRNDAGDIYAQTLDLSGSQVWMPETQFNLSALGAQSLPALAIDNEEAIYGAWQDDSSGRSQIMLQKIDAGGNIVWTAGDVRAGVDASAEQQNVKIAFDDFNNYIYVIWQDQRLGYWHIYLQKFDLDGNRIWVEDKRVDGATDIVDARNPDLAIDYGGNVFAVWNDNRFGTNDVFIQKISGEGNRNWTDDIRINLEAAGVQENPAIIINNNGYIVAAWQDNILGNYDIKAARFLEDLTAPSTIPYVSVTLTGSKKIGENPIIKKYSQSFTTNGSGVVFLDNLEWDSYEAAAGGGYEIKKTEPPLPIDILPGESRTLNIFLE